MNIHTLVTVPPRMAEFLNGSPRGKKLASRLAWPPEKIIALCGEDLAATKLLGAGGGGYMLLCARDPEAAARIRQRLENQPSNPRARFVEFAIAGSGMEVTVS